MNDVRTIRRRWDMSGVRLSYPLDVAVIAIIMVCSVAILNEPYRYYEDDALFYLQIARSLTDGGGLSFFPGLPTNGFHPFWLLICAALARIFETREGLGLAVVATMVLLNAGTALLIRIGLRRFVPAAALSIGLLISLPYIFFGGGVGMESSLAAFLYAAFMVRVIHQLDRPSAAGLVQCAALAGLAVFARLDLAIALVPIVLLTGWYLLRDWKDVRGLSSALPLAILLGALPTVAWLSFNAYYFGDPIPISGRLKLAAASGAPPFSLTGMNSAHLGLVVAAILALSIISKGRTSAVVIAAGAGQCLYLGYLALAGYSEIFSWYFVPLALIAGFASAALLSALADMDWARRMAALGRGIWAVLAMLLGLMMCAKALDYVDQRRLQLSDYSGPTSMAAVAARHGVRRVLTFDRPGQIAYFDGFATLGLDGLTTNLAFQKEVSARGADWLIRTYRIDALVGPKMGVGWGRGLCGQLYLGSTRFHCDKAGTRLTRVELYSRLNGHKIGEIDLDATTRIDFSPDRTLALYVLPRR